MAKIVTARLDLQLAPATTSAALYRANQANLPHGKPFGSNLGLQSVPSDGKVTFSGTTNFIPGAAYWISWASVADPEYRYYLQAFCEEEGTPAPPLSVPFRERRRAARRVVAGSSYL